MILLYWLLVIHLEALRHTFLIRVKKTSPNKSASFLGRFLIAWCLFALDVNEGIREWWVIGLTYLAAGWFIHDTILATLAMRQKPWYLNGTGPIDKLQNGYPFGAWAMKGIAAFTLIAMYYFNYL